MKYILCLCMLLPVFAIAQDCKLTRETDPYTKETKISSGFIKLQSGSSVTVDADAKEIDFFFTVTDKCFNDASTLSIFFEGSKTRTLYRNTGAMNCDGNFHYIFRNAAGTNTVLQKLGTLKVARFVFTGSDKKEVILTLVPEQQQKLMDAAACVTAEAKTLIK